jgi:O-antigen ligase
MLMTLQLYYVGVSSALFLYALYRPDYAMRAFVLGMAVNIFPLALQPYMNMDVARLAGMPLVYLPVTAVGVAMILRNGLRLVRRHESLYVLCSIYLIYTFVTTVLMGGLTAQNFIYWFAWPLNFLMFIAAAGIASRVSSATMDRVLLRCVHLLVAASIVGLLRFTAGIEPDANFVPLMNRNGTVVLIALLFPMVLHVHATQGKSRSWLLLCGGTIALCVALTFSRSGMIGLMAGVVLYYWRFSVMGMVKFAAAVIVVALFLASGIAERTTERLLMTGRTISALVEGREIDRSAGDHNRVMLVTGAMATAKENFWFGTGLGMENYRKGLSTASPLAVTSKAHNFYLSYFAELGIFGFALLLAILQRIYAGLLPLKSRYRAFRVTFLVMALMMTMNEYILLPELWVFFGMLAGISQRLSVPVARLTQAHVRPVWQVPAMPVYTHPSQLVSSPREGHG